MLRGLKKKIFGLFPPILLKPFKAASQDTVSVPHFHSDFVPLSCT